MRIIDGYFYFLSDSFFDKFPDKYLKQEHDTTKRPHYAAFQDEKTSLYWLVPCSSRVEKYERIIQDRKTKNKATDGIKIIKVRDNKRVLLFQDMFPSTEIYVKEPYIRAGLPVHIGNQKIVSELKKNAKMVSQKLLKGIKFTPTQPNIAQIEKAMLEELRKIKNEASTETRNQNKQTPAPGQKSIYQRISEIEAQAANNGQPSKPPHMANKKENESTL